MLGVTRCNALLRGTCLPFSPYDIDVEQAQQMRHPAGASASNAYCDHTLATLAAVCLTRASLSVFEHHIQISRTTSKHSL